MIGKRVYAVKGIGPFSFTITTCIFSQTVKKGSLLGLHKGTVTLSPNVTMAQFKDYYFNVYSAEFTKLFKVKMLEVAGIRGVDAKKK
jgi:hypothetical protein